MCMFFLYNHLIVLVLILIRLIYYIFSTNGCSVNFLFYCHHMSFFLFLLRLFHILWAILLIIWCVYFFYRIASFAIAATMKINCSFVTVAIKAITLIASGLKWTTSQMGIGKLLSWVFMFHFLMKVGVFKTFFYFQVLSRMHEQSDGRKKLHRLW